MTDAKVPATLPDWVKDHIGRYVATNGADGHIMTFASNPSGAVPTLLLTTTGRRSGEKFVFPLIYGTTGDERTKLWRQMTALFAPYADYHKKAGDREIPVVVLDPLPAR